MQYKLLTIDKNVQYIKTLHIIQNSLNKNIERISNLVNIQVCECRCKFGCSLPAINRFKSGMLTN